MSKRDKESVVSFRAPGDLVDLLDEYLEYLQEESPGGNWTRSSAAMNLVAKGLKGWKEWRNAS